MAKKLLTFQFDNIIVWRHAEAEIANFELGEDDEVRQLTHKGHEHAKRMARWLKKHLPQDTILICSPALRALQTAEALDYKIQLQDSLKPSASLADVLAVLMRIQNQLNQQSKKDQQKNVLIVGHQPWIGQLVAYLVEQSTNESRKINHENNTSIKKGAVWWLRLHSVKTATVASQQHVNQQYKLFTLQTPSLL
ncbi:MAG: histidine phosphatase family protein [Pseudomonadota bacterium]